jgi:hypothetical protein
MNRRQLFSSTAKSALAAALGGSWFSGKAQAQASGSAAPASPPGSASAQDVLPKPQPPFAGRIGRTAKESTPDFPKALEAPPGAPNVL